MYDKIKNFNICNRNITMKHNRIDKSKSETTEEIFLKL